jgi:hypothetical protein
MLAVEMFTTVRRENSRILGKPAPVRLPFLAPSAKQLKAVKRVYLSGDEGY